MSILKLGVDVSPVPLPDWLSADPSMSLPRYPTTKEQRELEKVTFLNMFEIFLEVICEAGNPIQYIESDPRGITYGRYIKWALSDPERKQRYEDAQTIGAEVHRERALAAAHGTLNPNGIPNEVARDSLIVNTTKWIMQTSNKKKYGDTKQIDVTTTNTYEIRNTLELREAKVKLVTPMTIEGEVVDES